MSYLILDKTSKSLKVSLRQKKKKIIEIFCEKRELLYDPKPSFTSIQLIRVPLVGMYYFGIAGCYAMNVHKDYIQNIFMNSMVLGNLLFNVDLNSTDLEGDPASNDWLIILDFLAESMVIWDHRKRQELSLTSILS